jgi:hypothetical protein
VNDDPYGTGGGGSGYGPAGVIFETGVRTGNGTVTITYDTATDSCPETPTTPTTTGTTTPYTPAVAAKPTFTG